MNDYLPEADDVIALKTARLNSYRKAIYERELNIAEFQANGETDRVAQEQAEINKMKSAIDAINALDS